MEYRDLLVTVNRRCQGLHKVKDLKEFKHVFIDIVERHHRAFTQGKVLHRDISEGNAMFYRDEEGAAVGLLGDFDNTSKVQIPFMALDILTSAGPPIPHFYRHDLESFFPTLAGWNAKYSYEFESAMGKTSLFWLHQAVAKSILEIFQPPFDPMKDEWVRPLRALKGFRLAEDAEDSKRQADFDGKTLGGVVMFESFMEALGQKPRDWVL
ncbi:hypothetical protein ARMGADRAFT_1166036 [Armillaria gallica]|uniref:Fungal-type protein kinase domain-containing protein n=1 Tax=Armillaria gallica TaxID=47427 RepID=A0A2H3DLV3_ARMGA|nr:hypothetical protein ARMGADRAFT_1166036 [Armillaria gallica]